MPLATKYQKMAVETAFKQGRITEAQAREMGLRRMPGVPHRPVQATPALVPPIEERVPVPEPAEPAASKKASRKKATCG